METLQKETEKLFDLCEEEGTILRELFCNGDFHEYRCLREYEAIVCIDQKEEMQQSNIRFWDEKMSVTQLLSKLRILKKVYNLFAYENKDEQFRCIEMCFRNTV